MAWYKHWFDSDVYEQVYGHRDLAEAEQIINLVEKLAMPAIGASILDVGTGRGRYARVLARHGFVVTGIDLSERAVESARERTEAEGLAATFLTGDMRLPHFQERFDGVVNLFTSFGFFEEESDHLRAIKAMSDALKPGGWLIQDFLNEAFVRATLVPDDRKNVDGTTIAQKRWIREDAPGGPRVEKLITVTSHDGPIHQHEESVRLLTLADFVAMYANAGLSLVGTYGNVSAEPFTANSPRLILHARKGR